MYIDQQTAVIVAFDRDNLDLDNDMIALCEHLAVVGGMPRHAIVIQGYDDDPRELYQIPECVDKVFSRILREVPQFIRVADDATFALILFATAVQKPGSKQWHVDPAWAPFLPNFNQITLARTR